MQVTIPRRYTNRKSDRRLRRVAFSTESMWGLLAGNKTQTRRLLACQPVYLPGRGLWAWTPGKDSGPTHFWSDEPGPDVLALCPFGKAGDYVAVCENYCLLGGRPFYQADYRLSIGRTDVRLPERAPEGKWTPARFMPYWLSRTTMEVVEVRLERLKAITFDDCLAEGIINTSFWAQDIDWEAIRDDDSRPLFRPPGPDYDDDGIDQGWMDYARGVYFQWWDSMHAAQGYGWRANPWVWAAELRRLERPRRPWQLMMQRAVSAPTKRLEASQEIAGNRQQAIGTMTCTC